VVKPRLIRQRQVLTTSIGNFYSLASAGNPSGLLFENNAGPFPQRPAHVGLKRDRDFFHPRRVAFTYRCLLISLVAGALGYAGIAAGAAQISKILFFIFLVIFLAIVIFAILAGQLVF
jgi:uncharacterized membrane protein YtjA (UPF0391 family)